MKFQNSEDSPWKWWQTIRLRAEMKKRMMPITPQVAIRRKERIAVGYCFCAFAFCHYILYKYGYLTTNVERKFVPSHHVLIRNLVSYFYSHLHGFS